MDHRYILAWFVFIFCRVDGESLYGLKGQSISLKPAIPDKPADILWKHNGNKVVEFNGNEEQVYGTFENRITLDWHTADIEITDLRFEDGGNYELEATINNKLHRSSKTLVVIDTVPKPTISCKMIDDSSSNKSGTLECSADYKHSQTQSLLKFEWGSHGNVQPGPQLTISLGDEHDDHEYICNVSNPKSSETTTFTAKDCYPDESSSVPLAVGLAVLFLIIFVVLVLGIAYSYKKHKACFAVKRDEESTKKVSDDHNTTAQVEERKLLLTPAASQPPHTGLDVTTALGDGNSQNVDEAYPRVPVKERINMFEGKKDGNMNKGKAPAVSPHSALSPEPANEPDPADESADSEEEKKSHQESSAAPEEPGLETTLSESGSEQTTAQAEENSTPTDEAAANPPPDMTTVGKMNEGKAPPVPPCSELSPAEEEDPQSDPSASEKANEPDQADSEEDTMSESSSAAPEEPGLENNKDEHEKTGTPPSSPCGKMNKGKDPLVPSCSESPEPAKKEDPQSDPSVSEKANEPDPADESADSKKDKMSESSSTVPAESEVSDDHNTTAQVEETEHLLPSSSSSQPPHTGLDGTTAPGDGNSQNVDEAYQPGRVKERIKSFGGKKGKAPPVPPRSALSSEPAKKEDPAVGLADSSAAREGPGLETTLSESGLENNKDEHEKTGTPPSSPCGKMNKGKAPPVPPRSSLSPKPAKKADPADEPADFEEEKKSHQESSAAPEEPGLKTTLPQSGSDQTTAQAAENSTPTDEAATDQQADRNKGYVKSVRRRFDPKFCEKS